MFTSFNEGWLDTEWLLLGGFSWVWYLFAEETWVLSALAYIPARSADLPHPPGDSI